MKSLLILLAGGIALAGCATRHTDQTAKPATPAAPSGHASAPSPAPSSSSLSLSGYKRDVATHISSYSAAKVYSGRPQALLRSVVVVKYIVDADGRLLRSEILRSNRDRVTETAALQALRSAAPLPKPAFHLLRRGQVEAVETWLFNNDGRFQLRTIAEPQMDR